MTTADRTKAVASSWGVPPVALGSLGVLRSGRTRWLRALAWLVVLFFATALAFGLPTQWFSDHLPAGNTAWLLAGRLGACALALGSYAVAVRVGEARAVSELSLRRAPAELALGGLIGVALIALLMAALVGIGAYEVVLVGPAPAWSAGGLAIQAAVTEELWMRALLFRLLWRSFGPVPAFGLCATIFAALHLTNPGANVVAGATVAVAGIMFCALYVLTGRLWLPIGVHAGWNFAQGYLFGAAVSGGDLGGAVALSSGRPGAPLWLTGGAFGPEGSLLALLVVTAVAGAALALVRRPSTPPAGTGVAADRSLAVIS